MSRLSRQSRNASSPHNATISAFRPLVSSNENGISVRPLSIGSAYREERLIIPVPAERIEQTIRIIRGHRVMLDTDLAKLYGVATKVLNQAVKRNRTRFPMDFMFQLTAEEAASLRSQIVTLKPSRGQYRKYRPYVFTEQGVAMLSSVLHSERAIQVNVAIMRAFVRLREMIGSNKALAKRLNELEKKYDSQFRVVFEAIRELMGEPGPKSRRIGFKT